MFFIPVIGAGKRARLTLPGKPTRAKENHAGRTAKGVSGHYHPIESGDFEGLSPFASPHPDRERVAFRLGEGNKLCVTSAWWRWCGVASNSQPRLADRTPR